MAELKPCPFCGSIPTIEDCECGDKRFFVSCKCGIVQDKLYRQKCDAVKQWNTRRQQLEVIRCKDCRWCEEHHDSLDKTPYWMCLAWNGETNVYGFCYEAERRTDEQTICNGMPVAESN